MAHRKSIGGDLCGSLSFGCDLANFNKGSCERSRAG